MKNLLKGLEIKDGDGLLTCYAKGSLEGTIKGAVIFGSIGLALLGLGKISDTIEETKKEAAKALEEVED